MSTLSAGTTVTTALVASGDTTGALTFQVSGTVTAATISSSGNVGIGGTANAQVRLDVTGTLPTDTQRSRGFRMAGTIPSGTTTNAISFYSLPDTQAASFTLTDLYHFAAVQGTFGAGSTVTNQYGYFVDSSLTGATNNYGFYSNIASGSNRWNFYANGTANNYFAGNVGIGTTSPIAIANQTSCTVNGTNAGRFDVRVNGTHLAQFLATSTDVQCGSLSTIPLLFYTNSTEKMRITSGGDMLLGTSTGLGEGARLDIVTASGEADVTTWRYANATAGKYWRWVIDSNSRIYLTNQGAVGVYINDGDTAWTAYSDERAKADLKPIEDSVNKVCQLRAVTGRFKKDEEGVSRSFLIAQDVQKVFPEAVSDINPDELGVRYTDVIPLLVAAVKELKAENDALKARIEALEIK